METKNYINTLKKKSKEPVSVAMRQALCYYLFSSNVPCTIIKNVMHMTRSNMYFGINHAKDMLETGDFIMRNAYEEIAKHKIRITPITADGTVFSQHVGYRMTIDNVIY